VLLLLAIGFLVVLALWILPKKQAARSQGLTAANRFDHENEARKTLAQIIGGFLVLAGIYASVQTFTLQREGQITDRFSKAIEQLGAVNTDGKLKLEVRLGGIYALERIAFDSERDQWPIIEVLTAYVRENSPTKSDASETTLKHASGTKAHQQEPLTKLRPDIQAILTVISRRNLQHDPPDRFVDLTKVDLSGANLSGANLSGANLSGANLSKTLLDKSTPAQ
jgi:Pentapeptide repeats (8 copies)